MFMFNNNYDVTNKAYLDRIRRGYKVHKETEQKENKKEQKKNLEKSEKVLDKSKKEKSDKGNNLDFYA